MAIGSESRQSGHRPGAWLYAGSALLSVAVIAYLFANFDFRSLGAILTALDWSWLAAAFGVYFINLTLRALRFRVLLLSRRAGLRDLLVISSLHNMFVYIMPAQTGDLSYIFLAKKRLDLPLPEGTATLLATRLYDFTTVALLLVLNLPAARAQLAPPFVQLSLLFSSLVIGGTVILLACLQAPWILISQPSHAPSWLARLAGDWNRLIQGLRLIRSEGQHLPIALLSLGIWACLYLVYYSLARGLGTSISILQISTITMVMIPLTLLPIQGFANVGTHELGWVSVLRGFGFSQQDALTIALGSHFLLLAIILIYGGLGLLATQSVRPRKQDRDEHHSP